jgi:hypothetical protein
MASDFSVTKHKAMQFEPKILRSENGRDAKTLFPILATFQPKLVAIGRNWSILVKIGQIRSKSGQIFKLKIF